MEAPEASATPIITLHQEDKKLHVLTAEDTQLIHTISVETCGGYGDLFAEFTRKTGLNTLNEFSDWIPNRSISEEQKLMLMGPPVACRRFMKCDLNGVEFRADDKRLRKNNSGCILLDGKTRVRHYGEIQYFLLVKAYASNACREEVVANVKWFETLPFDVKKWSVLVGRAPRSDDGISFAAQHKFVLVESLMRCNVVFQPPPRDWGLPRLHSTFVALYSPHQFNRLQQRRSVEPTSILLQNKRAKIKR